MIVIAVLVAQYSGTLDLSDTTRVAARVTQNCQPDQIALPPGTPRCAGPPPPGPPQKTPEQVLVAGDVSTTITARLLVRDRRWDYTLLYTPTVTAPDFEVGFYPELFQSGTASVAWHDRFTRILVSETASYGLLNSAFLYQLPVAPSLTASGATQPATTVAQPTPQAVPAAGTIDFGSSSTNGNIFSKLTQRTTLALTAGYTLGGGLTASARDFLPLQYGPTASVSISYKSSPIDSITTKATAQDTFTSGPCALVAPETGAGGATGVLIQQTSGYCKLESPILQLQEIWRHQVSPTAAVSLGAGAAALEEQEILSPTLVRNVAEIQPIASVILNDQLDRGGTSVLALSAQLAPFVDVRTGLSSDRVQLSASLLDQFTPTALATLTASLLQSTPFFVSDPYPITAVGGGAEIRVRLLHRLLDVGLGEQELWQTQSGYGTLFSFIGYVRATVRAPTLRF
jgi:hypothetical protein